MSLQGATRALETFLTALDEAEHMAAAGRFGSEFDDLFQHLGEMPDIMDEEMADVDREKHEHLFAAAPTLRAKIEGFKRELRSGGPYLTKH